MGKIPPQFAAKLKGKAKKKPGAKKDPVADLAAMRAKKKGGKSVPPWLAKKQAAKK